MAGKREKPEDIVMKLRLTLLAPEIVEAILDGRHKTEVKLDTRINARFSRGVRMIGSPAAGLAAYVFMNSASECGRTIAK